MRKCVLFLSVLFSCHFLFCQLSPDWDTNLTGPLPTPQYDYLVDFDTDTYGNTYVLMKSMGYAGFPYTDWIVSYSPTGQERWRKYFNYPDSNDFRRFTDIEVAVYNRVYIAGHNMNGSGYTAIHAEEVNSSTGNTINTYTNNYPIYTISETMTSDPYGNIWIGGTWYDGVLEGYTIVKIDALCNELLMSRDTLPVGLGLSIYPVKKIVYSSSGIFLGIQPYLSGSYQPLSGVIKFDVSGNKIFGVFPFSNITGILSSTYGGMAINTSGEIYLGGTIDTVTGNDTVPRAFVIKMDGSGNITWNYRESRNSKILGLGLLSNGDIVACGQLEDTLNTGVYYGSGYKFGTSGQLHWQMSYPTGNIQGPGSRMRNVEISSWDDIYFGELIAQSQFSIGVARISPADGSILGRWNHAIDTVDFSFEYLQSHLMVSFAPGILYFADTDIKPNYNTDGYLCRLIDMITSVNAETKITYQLFPNPASHTLTIDSDEHFTRGMITDMNGRVVFTFIPGAMPYIMDVSALSLNAGTYFMILEKDNRPSYHKFQVIR